MSKQQLSTVGSHLHSFVFRCAIMRNGAPFARYFVVWEKKKKKKNRVKEQEEGEKEEKEED